MPYSVAGHHAMLDHYATVALYAGLIEATTLAADVLAGATSVDVTHLVEAGDSISLNDGGREPRLVTAVSGTGPYTCTLDVATDFAHGVNTYVGHAPRAGSVVREAGGTNYARQSITWDVAAGENLNSSNVPLFEVQGDTAIGGFLLSDVADPATAVYHGGFLTQAIEYLGAAGRYELTDGDVSLTVLVDG